MGLLTGVFAIAGIATAALAAEPAAGPDSCPEPGTETVVIDRVETWRTLIGRDGRTFTPAAIADFGTIEPQSAELAAAAEKALSEALAAYAGTPLSVRLLGPKQDRRGRRAALLYAGDKLVQQQLVRRGLAIAYPHGGNLPCAAGLLGTEAAARNGRRGFWNRNQNWIATAAADQFAGRLNRFVILQARVVSVGTRANRTYLNFGGRWDSDVTVEIARRDRERLGGDGALEALAGRIVRIRGFAVEKSGPMIRVRRGWQIEVLTKSPI